RLRGVPTREDDGCAPGPMEVADEWGPYARGRRATALAPLAPAPVGSLRARTTGRCRTVIPPYKRAPRAQGRRFKCSPKTRRTTDTPSPNTAIRNETLPILETTTPQERQGHTHAAYRR